MRKKFEYQEKRSREIAAQIWKEGTDGFETAQRIVLRWLMNDFINLNNSGQIKTVVRMLNEINFALGLDPEEVPMDGKIDLKTI